MKKNRSIFVYDIVSAFLLFELLSSPFSLIYLLFFVFRLTLLCPPLVTF